MQQSYRCYSRRWKGVIVQVLCSKKITVVFKLKECWVSKKKSLDRQKYYYIVLFCTVVILNTVNIELLNKIFIFARLQNKNKIKQIQIVDALNSLILVLVQWIYRFRLLGLIGMDNWISNQFISNGLFYMKMFILNKFMVIHMVYSQLQLVHGCFLWLFYTVYSNGYSSMEY